MCARFRIHNVRFPSPYIPIQWCIPKNPKLQQQWQKDLFSKRIESKHIIIFIDLIISLAHTCACVCTYARIQWNFICMHLGLFYCSDLKCRRIKKLANEYNHTWYSECIRSLVNVWVLAAIVAAAAVKTILYCVIQYFRLNDSMNEKKKKKK